MGINIGNIDRELHWHQNFGYIDNKLVGAILDQARVHGFKCLKYLDKCDNTYFNTKQQEQLAKEIEILEREQVIPIEIIQGLRDCFIIVQASPEYLFGFIGD